MSVKFLLKKKKLYWAQEYSPALKEFNIIGRDKHFDIKKVSVKVQTCMKGYVNTQSRASEPKRRICRYFPLVGNDA